MLKFLNSDNHQDIHLIIVKHESLVIRRFDVGKVMQVSIFLNLIIILFIYCQFEVF